MKRIMFLLITAVLVLTIGKGADARADSPPANVGPEYLAMGDSLAAGVGASDPDTTAYVPLFHEYLKEALDPGAANPPSLAAVPDAFDRKFLQLRNLGVGGETSTTMISGGQLATALADLAARNGNATPVDDVRVITLDIGGNDVFPLVGVCAAGFTPTCASAISATFGTFTANFSSILGQLRAAAGPDTTIVVMTYYNALVNPGCPFNALAPLGDVVLEGQPALGVPAGLNDIIRAVAAWQGALVAETFGRLGPADLQPDCLHPDDSGYAIIAQAFVDALG